MKKIGVLAIGLLVLTGTFGLVRAGNLDPPGPPAPTMKTLDEVEPRIPILSAPLEISESGSYYLTNDLTSAATAIMVFADDVTIDLMGYSLVGPGSGSSIGIFIRDGHSNVEIRNGTIRNFGYDAIYDQHASGGSGHRIIGIRALSNGHGGIVLPASGDHLVKDCTAVGNTFTGIYVGHRSLITGCVASANDKWGIQTVDSSTVANCTASENTLGGIYVHESGAVLNSIAFHNGGDGIHTGAGGQLIGNSVTLNDADGIDTTAGLIVNNSVRDNQGVGLRAGDRSTVTNNTVTQNVTDGIRVDSNCTVKSNMTNGNGSSNIHVSGVGNAIEENLVTDSAYGIYFVQQANFYANNRASNNTEDFHGAPDGTGDGGGNVAF